MPKHKRRALKPKKGSFNVPFLVAVSVLVLIALPVILLVANKNSSSKIFASTINPVGQTGNWNMIFSDEFDGTVLDETKWIKCREWGQKDRPCESTTTPKMTYLPENIIVENGILRLRAQKGSFTGSNGQTYPYSSGMISTAKYYNDTNPMRFQHTYGYMEARIKVPKGQGLWPAFWNVASNGDWPPEIDVMENLTSSTHNTFEHQMHYHYNDASGTHRDSGGTWTSPVDLASDYHVYGALWEPNGIRWYVDGIERRSPFVESQFISAQDMFLILNLQVGGDWPGDPDSTTPFPTFMDVDYVRVWQRADAPVQPSTLIQTGAQWKYLDTNTRPADWQTSSFDDSSWKTGPAELGYGDGDEATIISYGGNASNKYPTAYFRHTFNVTDPTTYTDLELNIKRDDGAVVYLNGTEVFRTNMPSGTISHTTYSASSIDDNIYHVTAVSPSLLQTGNNVIAVEVHQSDASSSDTSMNLKLTGTVATQTGPTNTPAQPTNTPIPTNTPVPTNTPTPLPSDTTPPSVSITSPANNTTVTRNSNVTIAATASDASGISKVEFYVNGSLKCTDNTASYSCVWRVPSNKNTAYTLTAKAFDTRGNNTTSTAVRVTSR